MSVLGGSDQSRRKKMGKGGWKIGGGTEVHLSLNPVDLKFLFKRNLSHSYQRLNLEIGILSRNIPRKSESVCKQKTSTRVTLTWNI